MNLSSISRSLIGLLNQELKLHPDLRIVYCVDPDKRTLAIATPLLGSYTVIMMHMPSANAPCSRVLTVSWIELITSKHIVTQAGLFL